MMLKIRLDTLIDVRQVVRIIYKMKQNLLRLVV